jgi:transcriptional regulator with XRE-family HTH domain
MEIKLREVAKAKGLSLYRLAQLLSMPQQTIYSWATGRTQPSYPNMDLLCSVLECTLNDLFAPEPVAPEALAAIREYNLNKQIAGLQSQKTQIRYGVMR